jgi:DNA repair protein SbcD/Mre11
MDEFAGALNQVVTIAVEESIDFMVVAGDIYDQRTVSSDADQLIFDTFIRLHEAGIPIVALPGNHDSAARLSAFSSLLQRIGVTLVTRMLPPTHGGAIRIASRNGDDSALISCLPFVSPRRFSDAAQLFEDISHSYVNYDEGMGELLRAFEGAFDRQAINVVVGHMFVSGAQPGGGERQVTIGDDHAVSPARLPGTATYVALGHIHKPQSVRGAPVPARYCGSLIQLDFGERNQDKSVVIVDAEPGRPARTTEIPIDAGRRLCDITGTIDELPGLAAPLGNAFLRVAVQVEGPVVGISDRVRELLPNALDVRLAYDRSEDEQANESLRSMDPRDQFLTFYRAHHGVDPAGELVRAFDHVYEEVSA